MLFEFVGIVVVSLGIILMVVSVLRDLVKGDLVTWILLAVVIIVAWHFIKQGESTGSGITDQSATIRDPSPEEKAEMQNTLDTLRKLEKYPGWTRYNCIGLDPELLLELKKNHETCAKAKELSGNHL